MKLGMNLIGGATVAEVVADAQRAEREGFASFSMANIFGLDAINALTVAGYETSTIGLVTAVVPTFPRHPAAIAQQALTAASASGGRFTLGIGLSHKVVIEGMYGMSFDRPARHMREYLKVLLPLLNKEPVQVTGEQFTFRGGLRVPGDPVPCAIAAMGPAMLRLAGEQCSGTILWMTTAKAISEHIVPHLREGAQRSGRSDEPQVIVSLPIALTNDIDGAREAAAREYQNYGNLPSYRSMLDASGLSGAADAAIIGNEAELERSLRALAEAGTTLFHASCFPADDGATERTREFLASLAKRWN